MKTIGIIGGMSFESTITYYKEINEIIRSKKGGLNSAKILLISLNFEEIAKLQREGKWEDSANILLDSAIKLEQMGADFILIATNTMHKILPYIHHKIKIPFLHIAEAVGEDIKKNKISKVLLLGTKFTMKEAFYKNILSSHGIDTVIPSEEQIEEVNRIIFEELCCGKVLDTSKKKYIDIINKLCVDDVNGIILGCTEIGMLISQEDCNIKIFDSTKIHIAKAVELALEQ